MRDNKPKITQCELCAYFDPDEETCTINLDEDDMASFMGQPYSQCSYFSMYDEYKIVRKQN